MIRIRRQNAGNPDRLVVCAVLNNTVVRYWERQKNITDNDLCWLAVIDRNIQSELRETAVRLDKFDFASKHGFCLA